MRAMIRYVAWYFKDRQIVGAEVGVFRGHNAASILNRIPNVTKLYLVDPYEIYEGYDDANRRMVPSAKSYAKRLLEVKAKIDSSRYEWIYEKFTADVIPEPLDFIYIDGWHNYEPVLFDIQEAEKCTKKGGIIGGHDYYPIGHPREHEFGVGKAVRDHYKDREIHADRKDWWIVYD